MKQAIVGYHQDSEQHWVADLACGHTQHVRHQPPFQNRAWVTTDAGRSEMLGSELECNFCDMGTIPQGYSCYQRTKQFTDSSIPKGLLADHQTRPGTWGLIVVARGLLEYSCPRGVFVLRPGVDGVIEPEVLHHVRPLGDVSFHVEFYRERDTNDAG